MSILILVGGYFIYNFAPENWFSRVATIENEQQDESATSRIYVWKVSLQIADSATSRRRRFRGDTLAGGY